MGRKSCRDGRQKPDSNVNNGSIQAMCKKNFYEWKWTKEVFFVEELPSNTMGKMLK
jgi:acyl-coenzyme A synthetase/AMP-(fatty) acid ligase